jgi:hypothetical protein
MFHLLDSDTGLRECGTVLSVNKLVPIMNIAEILLSNNISLSKCKSIMLVAHRCANYDTSNYMLVKS